MISVVMTSYNYSTLLPRAINAVLEQTVKPSEFIIIDDNSTDNSIEVINSFKKKTDLITVIKNSCNNGVIWATNYGLTEARCPYVLFTTADDYIYPTLIEESIKLLDKYPQAAFFMATTTIINNAGDQTGVWRELSKPQAEYINQSEALTRMRRCGFWFNGATTVFRRQMLIDAGGFKSDLGHFCDTFVSQVLALRHGFCYVSKSLAAVRMDGESYSQCIKSNATRELLFQKNVVTAMRTEYSNIFPTDFIHEWEQVNRLIAAAYSWRSEVFGNQISFLNEKIRLFKPETNFFDSCFIVILKTISWTQFLFFLLYLSLALGRGRLFMQFISLERIRGWVLRLKTDRLTDFLR